MISLTQFREIDNVYLNGEMLFNSVSRGGYLFESYPRTHGVAGIRDVGGYEISISREVIFSFLAHSILDLAAKIPEDWPKRAPGRLQAENKLGVMVWMRPDSVAWIKDAKQLSICKPGQKYRFSEGEVVVS